MTTILSRTKIFRQFRKNNTAREAVKKKEKYRREVVKKPNFAVESSIWQLLYVETKKCKIELQVVASRFNPSRTFIKDKKTETLKLTYNIYTHYKSILV